MRKNRADNDNSDENGAPNVKREFNQRAERPEHLVKLLEKIENMDIGDLPYSERSKLIQHLSQQIVTISNDNNITASDEIGVCVDENEFEREIIQIHRLLKSMPHSEYLKQWALYGARHLARQLEEVYPYKETAEKWKTMGLDEKKALLKDIVKLQAKIFGAGTIDMLPSDIQFDTTVPALGYVLTKAIDLPSRNIPHININKGVALHDDFNLAAETTVHEQLHAFITQLAIADFHGWMPADHPMSNDAAISRARREFLGVAIGVIRSVYRADPEETIAHECHQTFGKAYAGAAKLEAKA